MRNRPIKYSITAAMAFSLAAGCTGSPFSPGSSFGSPQDHIRTVKTASACPCLYVANGLGNSITVYPVGKTGNVAPSWYISGSNTELNEPDDIAVDSNDNIYVASVTSNSINVYAAGATGNVAPEAVITGADTGLNEPWGVGINPVNGDIYAANLEGAPSEYGSITFYAPGSNGNVAPLGTIAGSNTMLSYPYGVTLDPSGNIYVANGTGTTITVYAPGSSGNVAPAQYIGGSNTHLYEPQQVAFDSSLNIYVVDYGDSSVTAYPAGSKGNVPPSKGDITGKKTKLDLPTSIALDASGKIYVSNTQSNTVTIYAAGSNGNAKPYKTLKGSKTMLNYPTGIAVH